MSLENSFRVQQLVIEDIIRETADTKSFVLGLSKDENKGLEYKAGQFLTFIYHNINGEEVRKNYSISSSPVLDEPSTITVKRIDNGEFSRRLVDNAKTGDKLLCTGAAGFFTLPDNLFLFTQVFFIVAGSGITPAYALIKTILHVHPALSVVLIYSNSSRSTTIFYSQLTSLRHHFGERFKIEFLFSNAPNLLRARLNLTLLDNLLKEYAATTLARMLFYICGPSDYMRMVSIYLNNQQVSPAQVKKEIFNIEKMEKRPQPPDKAQHVVTINTGKRGHRLLVQYPTTILQAAKKAGLNLPYSCESGQCGTCAARCIKGKVWMYNNEVLTDDELQKGIILTCTAYPIDGDVTLQV